MLNSCLLVFFFLFKKCVSIIFVTVVENMPITTCNESTASGQLIYIDFYKINRSCLCIVTPYLSEDLLVTAQEIRISSCPTQVVVNSSRIIGCPHPQETSDTFKLSQYQSIAVQAEFSPSSLSGTFYQCLGFQLNGKIFF